MRPLLFFLPLLLTLSSCTTDSSSNADDAASFYPLETGNRWYYSNFHYLTGYDTARLTLMECAGRTLLNGTSYAMIVRKERPYGDTTGAPFAAMDTVYYRTAGSRLYRFARDYGVPAEMCAGDFALASGETYSFTLPDGQEWRWTVTVGRPNDDERSFSFDVPNAVDEEHTETYRRGVGPVSIDHSYGPRWRLERFEAKE